MTLEKFWSLKACKGDVLSVRFPCQCHVHKSRAVRVESVHIDGVIGLTTDTKLRVSVEFIHIVGKIELVRATA